MRISVVMAAILAAAPLGISAGQDPTARDYATHTFGTGAVVRSMMGAGVNQATNTPSEWHQGMAGFGRRFASAFGKHIVKKTIEFPIAKLRHEPFTYQPSDRTGFKTRTWYALSSIVITHRTTDGKPMLHSAELSGAIGSGLISRAWQPASTGTIAAGFESAGLTLLADAGGNMVHEFWPEIRHPHSRAKAHAERSEKIHAKQAAETAKALRAGEEREADRGNR